MPKTTTDVDPLEGAATEPVDAGKVAQSIPMKRWGIIRKRLGINSQEVFEDNFLLMLVVAHEWNFQNTGQHDQWDRFQAMGVTQLTDFLGLGEGQQDGAES